jgi:CRP-like cAMP-binding protein
MISLEQNIRFYFETISENDLKTVASFFRKEELQKGEDFLVQGKPCMKMSFVQEGIIRIYADTETKEVTQWISTPGYFLTDLAGMVFGSPSRWTMKALSDCQIFTIYKKDYDALGKLIPEWHHLEKLFIAKCFITMEERIFSHLSMTAEERYQVFFEQNKELFNMVPLQYIASMLGMTPETFSRIRRKQLEA